MIRPTPEGDDGKEYQYEENFESCTFQFSKVTIGQQLGQSINFTANTQK